MAHITLGLNTLLGLANNLKTLKCDKHSGIIGEWLFVVFQSINEKKKKKKEMPGNAFFWFHIGKPY